MSARILVVDDDPTNRKLVRRVLEAGGHAVDTAADAIEAGDALARTRHDVLVTDVSLPGEDGLSFVRRLRADPAWGALRVLAISGWSSPRDEADALAAGCDGWIAKPVEPERLLLAVGEVCGRPRAR